MPAQVTHIRIAATDAYPLAVTLWEPQQPIATALLVHGVVSHAQWLDAIGAGLAARGIRCVAPDRRGAGRNGIARGDAPDCRTLLDDLHCVIQHCADTGLPLHLCGFCWGANCAVHYALADSGGLASLCLLAPSLFPAAALRRPLSSGSSALATEAPPTPVELFTRGPQYREFILPDPLRLRAVSPRFNGILQQMSQMLAAKCLKLTQPMLLLLAQQDAMVDNAATEKLFARLKVSPKQLHTLPAAHGIQFDAPQRVTELLAGWIGSLRP